MTSTAGEFPAAWRSGGLAVLDAEVVRTRLARPALSASTMKSMQSCPARWVADKLLTGEEDPFAPAALGGSAHTVMENLLGEKPARRTRDRAIELILDLGQDVWREDEQVPKARWVSAVMDKMLGLFDIENPAEVDVISREERFNGIELDGVPFTGVIDRVERMNDGSLRVGDYKTGRALTAAAVRRFGHDPEGDQLRLYAAAYEAKYAIKPKHAALLYTAAGKSRKVSVTGPAIKRTLAEFATSWKDVNSYTKSGNFPCKTSPLCGWCPLVSTCPAAKAEGKEAKIDVPSAVELPIPVLRIGAHDATATCESPWHESVPDAHQDSNETTAAVARDEETAVIEGFSKREAKPWENPPVNGLDANSYTAQALFSLVAKSVELLQVQGLKVTRTTVQAMAGTLAHIVLTAQEQAVGNRDWQAGANTRMRGALFTVLETTPPPFGKDESTWSAWVSGAVRRCTSIAAVVIDLHIGEIPDEPWGRLATRSAETDTDAA